MLFQVLQCRCALELLCQQRLLCQKKHCRWDILVQSYLLGFLFSFGKGNYASQSQNSGFTSQRPQPEAGNSEVCCLHLCHAGSLPLRSLRRVEPGYAVRKVPKCCFPSIVNCSGASFFSRIFSLLLKNVVNTVREPPHGPV